MDLTKIKPETENERIMFEWLQAIHNEYTARLENANSQVMAIYAGNAMRGEKPHWYTDEYKAKVGH